MCGRFSLGIFREQLPGLPFPAEERESFSSGFHRFNIAPGQDVAVLRLGPGGEVQALALRWGLIPSWAKDPAIAHKLINARCETAAEKPSFRSALKKRRCVVLADGFYEWAVHAGGKQPVHLGLKGLMPFGIAGLWEKWAGPDGDVETCTLLTCEANPFVSPVHGRMPVILGPGQWEGWLRAETEEARNRLLHPYPAEGMEGWPVSTMVNAPRNEQPACREPAGAYLGFADRA